MAFDTMSTKYVRVGRPGRMERLSIVMSSPLIWRILHYNAGLVPYTFQREIKAYPYQN
jgi:hypothetical protein